LCFLYLRNVKGHRWNHKRVYRIYRELELNLRIKPRKRIVREKPEPLAVPETINLRIPTNLDSHSEPNWTRIPEQTGQSERSDAGFRVFTLLMPLGSSFCRAA
jgi:hypothetical protein